MWTYARYKLFWDFAAPLLRLQIPDNPNFWGVNRHFQAKCTKYWNLCVIGTAASITTKFCTVIAKLIYQISLQCGRSCWFVQIESDIVTLQWQRRLYDTRGNAHPNARSRHNVRQKHRLDTERHCCKVDVTDWGQLLSHIEHRRSNDLCSTVVSIAEKAKQYQQNCIEPVSYTHLTLPTILRV